MRKLLLAVCLALPLVITGCSSSTTASQPILVDQCKAIATEQIKAPEAADMVQPSTPILYTENQLANGVSRSEVVDNQSSNNALWDQDRSKLIALQDYIKTLQAKGIISN